MLEHLTVGLGGFVGAIARYTVSKRVNDLAAGPFPTGTLVVNIVGCLLIGVLLTLATNRSLVSREAEHFLVAGLLGSLTTFSTFGWDTVMLIRGERYSLAALSVGVNVVVGIGAVLVGRALARGLVS